MERRDFFRAAGGLAGAAVLTSCAARPAAAPPKASTPAAAHLLFADVSAQVAAFDTRSGTTLFSAARPIPAAAWDYLYTVSPAGELVTLEAGTGKETSRTAVPPGLVARAVSQAGNAVALGAPAPADPYGAPGRKETTLVIADPAGRTAPKVVRLKGNFEPDGFSGGGEVLFVLEYLPATAPESYRVRAYDIESGTLGPLLTRNKTPVPKGDEETMRGEGRAAVLSPDRSRLYTLYTHQQNHLHTRDLVAGRKTGVHAFVHVLDLNQRWAYCLDLPEPFGHGPAAGHTLAVSAGSLYVYDGASGTAVRASTDSLEIVTKASPGASPGTAAAAPARESLYIAAGTSLRAVDPISLAVLREWRLPTANRGVAAGPDDRGVYAGVTDGVLRFSGAGQPSRLPFPGITWLRHASAPVAG
ncbi:YncE family protein [Sphaerisporangium corydalis]|uniref:YncE family protein n=1 Tax=Sphaerisporangium corydalis TaxID=1441875 RepID=A0ABV9EPM9_9ACTN|nr:PQQ-like beta-propeller repeat protein [Sphaerisporangium corydalis]